MKRCIYHVPYPIETDSYSGSAIRPRKMLEAFRQNFDEVFVISGYGAEREIKFKELKKQVKEGKKYAFMYSENSTMPNLLTEKNHMPRYPFLEKNIYKFCKKNHIPIGLFYRDIDWRFSHYKKAVSFYKRCITLPLYQYDLMLYNKYIDILYLPSLQMGELIDYRGKKKQLPPGIDEKDMVLYEKNTIEKERLQLFYVGGVGGRYDLTKLAEGIAKCDFVDLTICCHEKQWKDWCEETKLKVPPNIRIVQGQGEELEQYYKEADLAVLFINAKGYANMAMPIKLFEYLGHHIPVISTNHCEFGDFVEKNKIGWSIKYDVRLLEELLRFLNQNRNVIKDTSLKMDATAKENTWSKRALAVGRDLQNIKWGSR